MPEPEPTWTPDALAAPHDLPDKARRVRRMFNDIAPTYERINTIFSGGRDAHWRRRAVALVRVEQPDIVLDVACGTGDFARMFASAGARTVIGCDFAHGMLVRARARAGEHTPLCEGDALRLPFGDRTFTIVSCAFGVRNFQNLERGLREMYRVLRRGGRIVILEFSRPSNRLFRVVHEFYAGRIMPIGATWISRDRLGAYRYLPHSVVSFADADGLCGLMRCVGFADPSVTRLTFGVVTVFVAAKP